jgi:hypothetical protein
MKIRMISKYECGQSLSATACELGFVVSTVNTVLKDITHIGHVKGMAKMKWNNNRKHEGVISEMEKLLRILMKVQIQKHVPLSLMTIQAEAKTS